MTKSEAKYWNIRELDNDAVGALASNLNETELLTSVLYNRGIRTPQEAESFLHPSMKDLADDFLLENMAEAVELCLSHAFAGSKILIFGDNDVDGVTSTTLIYQFFEGIAADVEYFLPRRLEDGHGFNDETLGAALSFCEPKLLISVDCGMSGVSEIAKLKARGIDVLVIDHHSLPERLPDTLIVNPKLPNSRFPHRDLAAVGVVFHVVSAMVKTCIERGVYASLDKDAPDLTDMLDLVCLGTIADVVPLLGENRTFVSLGLDVIRKRKRSGIAALLSDVGADDKFITERTICYRLAPRINAAGRMGNPNECVALLTAYRFMAAQDIARSLEAYNSQRQNAEASIINEATAMAQQQVLEGRRILVIAKEGWQQGILGIISSRILDKFYKPTVIISINDGKGRGSARSPEGFSILDAFSKCKDLIEDFGGHHSAAGLSILAENIPELMTRLERIAGEVFADPVGPRRSLDIDAEANVGQLLSLWHNQYLELLGPFGAANKEPTFMIKGLRVVLVKRLNHIYARVKLRQDGASIHLLVPSALVPEMRFGVLLDVVVTPKYAPHRDYPEFILLAVTVVE